MALEQCTACASEIAPNKPSGAKAVTVSGKMYCGDCAELILSPEDLEALRKPAALKSPASDAAKNSVPAKKPALMDADDELFGNEIPESAPVSVPANAKKSGVVKAVGSGVRSASAAPKSKDSAIIKDVRPGSGRGIKNPVKEDSKATKDKESRAEKKRERASNSKSNGMYIGIGVGVVALVVILVFALGGKKSPDKVTKKALVDEDKISSTEYARRADDYLSKKDNVNAAAMLRKAAEKADKEGDTKRGQMYQMKIVSIEKASKLNDGR